MPNITPRELTQACDNALEMASNLTQVYLERCLDLNVPTSVALAVFSALVQKQVEVNLESGGIHEIEIEFAKTMIDNHPGSTRVVTYSEDGAKQFKTLEEAKNHHGS